ncbi:MAG: endonuclease III domain-containing protein [Halobacteriota archaeon]
MKSLDTTGIHKGNVVIRRLEALYGDASLGEHNRKERRNPFWLIVETILSQNTSAANSAAAFQRLTCKYNTLDELAAADIYEVEDTIKQAGLYTAKARSIVSLAREIEDEFAGDTWLLLAGPYESARKRLLTLAGIGEKTADVVLLFARGFQIIPVDTHIFRVSRRIGLAPQKGSYDAVKNALEEQILPAKRRFAHVALIKLGREICSARTAQHWKCPLTDICDYYQEVTYGASQKAHSFKV